MKRFLCKILLFVILPFVALFLVENDLPATLFTFRCWEACSTRKSKLFFGTFYPNQACIMIEQGDLGHHTPNALFKPSTWHTDELGFRNDQYIPEPDILIIGDSNTVSTGLTQEDTLTNVLARITGQKVYNIASCEMDDYVSFRNLGKLTHPKIVIFSRVERGIANLKPVDPAAHFSNLFIRENPFAQILAKHYDRSIKANSLKFLKASFLRATDQAPQPIYLGDMNFLQGKDAQIIMTDQQLEQLAAQFAGYRDYFQAMDCHFIFLPIPNKETIYFNLLGLEKQPDFLRKLLDKLNTMNVQSVDTLALFNQLKAQNSNPYHRDDTHWNKIGVEHSARLLAQQIKSQK